jgi:hypothetical protein
MTHTFYILIFFIIGSCQNLWATPQEEIFLEGKCAQPEVIKYDKKLQQQMEAAKKAKNWDQLMRLQKKYVREMCSQQFRWYLLFLTTVKKSDKSDTFKMLEIFEARQWQILSLQKIYSYYVDTSANEFLSSETFFSSEYGKKAKKILDQAQERKKQFAEKFKKMSDKEKPPEKYVAMGACPFECCTFRKWDVLNDTELFESPQKNKHVATVKKGETALGVTGEVHLKPRPVAVVFDNGELKNGDIIFQLDNLGEGFSKVWVKGQVKELDVSSNGSCYPPSKECWTEPIWDETSESIWWVKIQTNDGKTGWTRQTTHFGNMDACG